MGRLFLSILLVGILAGCSATRESSNVSLLEAKVANMERAMAARDQQIEELRSELDRLTGFSQRSSASSSVGRGSVSDIKDKGIIRVSASPQDVQMALQKAGYYNGEVDGKIGRQTTEAIKQFQKDHELKVDGIVGRGTWAQMESYLKGQGVSDP